MKCFLKTYSIKLRFKIPYTIICVLFFLVNSYTLAKSFKSSSPDSALSFLTNKRIPVITCNMRTAFHINYYYENSSFLLVADNKYSDYLHNFSKHTNPIDLPKFISGKFVNESTNKFKEFIFITDNTSKSLNIPIFAKSNNFKIYDEIKFNHPEAHKAYFIKTKL